MLKWLHLAILSPDLGCSDQTVLHLACRLIQQPVLELAHASAGLQSHQVDAWLHC